jgi:uncharacterized DUF497 family protein
VIADGASLEDILDEVCRSIEVQAPTTISTILLMDSDGKQLWHAAGRRVPRDWLPAISPRPIGPREGCCGAAAFFKRRVIVADVATDPVWSDEHRQLALENGIFAAWSQPILTKDGEVLGTFALYAKEPRTPTDAEVELIEGAAHIALIAIARQRSQEALRKSEAELRRITDVIPQSINVLAPDGRTLYAKVYYTYSRVVHVGPEEGRVEPQKHGVSFVEAASVFADPLAAMLDDALDPERAILVGHAENGRVLLVVFIEQSEDTIRIISARRATSHERKRYEEGDW